MNTNTDDNNNAPPSDDELQQQARDVWSRIQLFYVVLFLGLISIVVIGGSAVYQSFGIEGVAVGALVLIAGFMMVNRWLQSF